MAKIRVIVHTMGKSGPTTSNNHWSIYLILLGDDGSARANMSADYGDPEGVLKGLNTCALNSKTE